MSFQTHIAVQRFGLGESVRGLSVVQTDPKKWIYSQISRNADTRIKGNFKTTAEITRDLSRLKDADREMRKDILKDGRQLYMQEMEARFNHAVNSQTPLIERLAIFWSNHFTVSAKAKGQLWGVMGAFEREAIRPHIFGKFSDMLLAVVRHPAMLSYLDNVQSFGPNSRVGQRRDKGLNENLAREILELHTLGVNGGYTQQDVIALAKIITGWGIIPPAKGGGGFRFNQAMHEPGGQNFLGKTYNEAGEQQGISALTDIANHPSTAWFISQKLATHFVSDNPSRESIQRLETVFLNTKGDLLEVTKALVELPEVWAKPLPKIKKPYEMIVSSFRLLDLPKNKIPFRRTMQSLGLLDHLPFQALSPAGWPDKQDDWMSPNAMMNRVEWSHAMAQMVNPQDNPFDLARSALGEVASPQTLLWISRAPSATEGLALLLASPEWQKR